jgi:pyridinium-3,5-bisthiocarboxylic acid mononucleotide nickel chelatase
MSQLDRNLHLHLDCASGIAGDMFLGACLDLGLPPEVLVETVARLGLSGVGFEARRAIRGGVTGTRFRVLVDGRSIEGPDPEENGAPHVHHDHHGHSAHHHHSHGDHSHRDHGHHHHHHAHGHQEHGRHLSEIRRMLAVSGLDPAVRERAERLFVRLGEAEAKVHGISIENVHFHEVGAIDSIVDLVGAAAAFEHLAPARLTSSAVNVGSGRVKTAHGELPVPAPATSELLRGMPIYGAGVGELTTPTGATLLGWVDAFEDLPPLVLAGSGYGLGKRELTDRPNAFRLLAGRPVVSTVSRARCEVAVIECEVDDLPGEGFGFLMERLFEAGALDVYFTPVQMKKNRPGTLVTLLARTQDEERLAGLLLAESGSLGCRLSRVERIEAERLIEVVETPFGAIAIKRATLGGRALALAPEYDDCRRAAR